MLGSAIVAVGRPIQAPQSCCPHVPCRQSDETDLGHSYEELDPVLEALTDGRESAEQLRARAVPPGTIEWAAEALRTGVSLAAVAPVRTGV